MNNLLQLIPHSFRRTARPVVVALFLFCFIGWFLPTDRQSSYFHLPGPPPPRRLPVTATWEVRKDGKIFILVAGGDHVVPRQTGNMKLRHPILDLVEEAERKWEMMLKRQAQFRHCNGELFIDGLAARVEPLTRPSPISKTIWATLWRAKSATIARTNNRRLTT